VPLWITVLLGVLAVVGTVGGAWGGQIIAGRNESRRWQRERDREAHAVWRDKRLEVYSTVLAAAQSAAHGLSVAFDGSLRREGEPAELPTTMEHVERELHTLWVIGSRESVELTMAIRSASLYADALVRSRRPAGKTAIEMLSEHDVEDLRANTEELGRLVLDLRAQFRADLGLSPPDHSPTGRWRRRAQPPTEPGGAAVGAL
jgi:hypothetical protein